MSDHIWSPRSTDPFRESLRETRVRSGALVPFQITQELGKPLLHRVDLEFRVHGRIVGSVPRRYGSNNFGGIRAKRPVTAAVEIPALR